MKLTQTFLARTLVALIVFAISIAFATNTQAQNTFDIYTLTTPASPPDPVAGVGITKEIVQYGSGRTTFTPVSRTKETGLRDALIMATAKTVYVTGAIRDHKSSVKSNQYGLLESNNRTRNKQNQYSPGKFARDILIIQASTTFLEASPQLFPRAPGWLQRTFQTIGISFDVGLGIAHHKAANGNYRLHRQLNL